MSLIPNAGNEIENRMDYGTALLLKNELSWEKLRKVSVAESIEYWLETLPYRTRLNYAAGMNQLEIYGLISPMLSLQEFAMVNHEAIVDKIKLLKTLSEASRQARAACYISFTRFLYRRSEGLVKKAIPCREGINRTFYKIREKVATASMNRSQWMRFLDELEKINFRDALIAKIVLQGGKRINEVLTLIESQISWDNCEITFRQSKTKGFVKETIITYPKEVIETLRTYVGSRTGFVFVTRALKPVQRNQVAESFKRAGIAASIPFKVTPHVLRASAVTYLKQQGFQDSDIMRVTGHASSEMVHAYDKSSLADNATKRISLIS